MGGTLLNVGFTALVGYTISRKHLRGASLISFLYIFTMLFSGGMIPTYLVVRYTGLINSLAALIIPGLVSPFNLILVRNFMAGIPDSLEESAKMDGASNLKIFRCIMVPIALPVLATISIYSAVGHWNVYMPAIMYLNKRALMPLQVYLRELVISFDSDLLAAELMKGIAKETIRAAAIMLTSIPIILVYPFLQRYFIKGVVLGAVKE